jgi:cytochrome c peroxidase
MYPPNAYFSAGTIGCEKEMFAKIAILVLPLLIASCSGGIGGDGVDQGMLRAFAPLPRIMASDENPVTPEKAALGRRLYHDPRFSPDGTISCASCHPLDRFGVDGKPVSNGHHGAAGMRNSPTVFNAAGHFVQFWDGRAATIEEQVRGPLLNPVEMAMPSEQAVVTVLGSDPLYEKEFRSAFPGQPDPLTFENMALAIGAFERTLTTPSRWDDYLNGNSSALTPQEKAGFTAFTRTGCMTCHRGPYVGGEMYSRLGITRTWPNTKDLGRYEVTRHERDRLIFKVPGLRNVAETAPYLHDGSIATLEEAVRLMADYQLARQLTDNETRQIVTWLNTLTGAP